MGKHLAVALVVILAAAGCGGPTDPSQNRVEPFSGTVQPQNTGPVHSFAISNTGEFSVSVTALTPGNGFIGVGWGQLQGSNCAPFIQSNVVAGTSVGRTALSGSVLIKGTYCVQAFDPSLLFGGSPMTIAQNYTIQVSHP